MTQGVVVMDCCCRRCRCGGGDGDGGGNGSDVGNHYRRRHRGLGAKAEL